MDLKVVGARALGEGGVGRTKRDLVRGPGAKTTEERVHQCH